MNEARDRRETRVLLKAMSVILPTPVQTFFLRACLHEEESAQQAWREWCLHTGGIQAALNADVPGIKSLLPLLHMSGVVDEPVDRTYVRSAYLREKLRSETYREICSELLLAYRANNIPVLVVKGAALAETIYTEPALRHCHDLDLLSMHDNFHAAARLTESLGWTRTTFESDFATDNLRYEHRSGLPLELHARLFPISYYGTPIDEVWSRSVEQSVVGVASRILSVPDTLLHICGHAACSRSRGSLRWIADAWFLIKRHPGFDWTLLADRAQQMHLALPLSAILSYLKEDLDAQIPDSVLHGLRDAARSTGATGRAAALLGAQATPSGTFQQIMRTADGWRERTRILAWMLFPPPIYFSWRYGARNAFELPICYLRRPAGYVVRYIARRIPWRQSSAIMKQY